jgi:heme/copper-type cytochrome/quinol oxidase subunit 2
MPSILLLHWDSPESESDILNASTGQPPIKFVRTTLSEFKLRFFVFEMSLMAVRRSVQFGLILTACIASLAASCVRKTPAEATHIHVTMRQFAIEPKLIEVKQAQNVVLEISTEDVLHGFMVPKLGINEPIQPGNAAAIHLDTSRKGEFEVTCSILCGAGHDDMRARILIK